MMIADCERQTLDFTQISSHLAERDSQVLIPRELPGDLGQSNLRSVVILFSLACAFPPRRGRR